LSPPVFLRCSQGLSFKRLAAGPSEMIAFLRDAQWLDRDRAIVYARMLAIFMVVGLLYGWTSDYLGHHPFKPPPDTATAGKPQPGDFVAFWAAGRLAVSGHPQAAYDVVALSATERDATALGRTVSLPFLYPPTFLLVCLPFALLPYFVGFLAFVGAQTVALLAVLRQLLPPSCGWVALFSFPALLMNAATGQNGCISATCFGLSVLLLEERPFLAGACLGCLVVKPHFSLCVPVALLAARRWDAVAGAAVSSLALMGAAWAAFGATTWIAFLHHVSIAQSALQGHPEQLRRLQSLFAALRMLSFPQWAAYSAQLLFTLAIVSVVAVIVRRRPGGGVEATLSATAALLCTPYILDYDLALTGVPLAWIACRAQRGGWLPWEKIICGTVFLWPLVARTAGGSTDLPFAPMILLGLFALVARRGWAQRGWARGA